ncbi:MAG: hypothetical protein LWY06_09085 [Firmicutes bacterium]|nr:hypothetical protein [Bacillota bacterium]
MQIKDEKQRALLKLPAKRISTILDELAGLRRRFNSGEDVVVPLVTLILKSGREITGWFISYESDRNETCLLFQLYSIEGRMPTYDILYISPASIEGLIVHNAVDVVHHLSFGKISRPPGLPAPSRLDLKRKAREFSEKLSEALGVQVEFEIDWQAMPDYDEVFCALADFLNLCSGVMAELADEEFSREIVAKVLKKIIFRDAPAASAKREADTIILSSPLSGEDQGRFTKNSLREAIESLF